jgi:guanylate kinase
MGRTDSNKDSKGRLIIISAPSGAGKSTVIQKLLKECRNIVFSISYTTRNIRSKEKNGVDYHFIRREQFEKMMKERKFLEWAVVHNNYYGTSKADTRKLLVQGYDVLLDIDVQGAKQVSSEPFDLLKIFILPPSRDALIARMKKRGDLSQEQTQIRLKAAIRELKAAEKYDYVVLNENVNKTVEALKSIILSEKKKMMYNKHLIRQVIDSFRNGE